MSDPKRGLGRVFFLRKPIVMSQRACLCRRLVAY